jgi:methyl-accepting chemotaxis protein
VQSRSQVTMQQSTPPDLRRRNAELNQIADSIAQLADLFKDLSALVIDQGTLLDSVEYNIEQTAVHMQEANKDLDVATRSVSSARSRARSPTCPRRAQVPEEHGPKEMHFSPPAHHLRPNHGPHL